MGGGSGEGLESRISGLSNRTTISHLTVLPESFKSKSHAGFIYDIQPKKKNTSYKQLQGTFFTLLKSFYLPRPLSTSAGLESLEMTKVEVMGVSFWRMPFHLGWNLPRGGLVCPPMC